MKNLLIAGNSTMPPCVGIFNLPPLKTCTPSPWCRKHCYGLQNRFTWKNVKASSQWRFQQSKRKDFVNRMSDEIHRRSFSYIRLHIIGDFYNEQYLVKWYDIIKQAPKHVLFRWTTRRQDLIPRMKQLFYDNQQVIIRESVDTTRIGTGKFPLAAINNTNGSEEFFTCIDYCSKCGFYCYRHPEINVVTQGIR